MPVLSHAARRLERFPDSPAWFDRHFGTPARQALFLLILGLALRFTTFGDPNLHVDEAFYYVVGIEMHHGALPYVEIWDRKPIGLFLIYYLITAISTEVVGYQIAAWLFASATALVIARIAARWTGTQGALLAGASYLFMLGPQEGYGGQTPVFYNLLIAGAVLLLVQSRSDLQLGRAGPRIYLAMALCGIALTVKQTTLFESLFLGLFVALSLLRSSVPVARSVIPILACALLGALPTVASGAAYFWLGHWAEFWQAMVNSNLAKIRPSMLDLVANLLRMLLRLYPYFVLVWLALRFTDRDAVTRNDRWLLGGWLGAAIVGVIVVPNFYAHYALPLLVPLAVIASPTLDRRDIGLFLAVALAAFTFALYNPLNLPDRNRSIASMQRMTAAIKAHDGGGGLLVFDGPPALYALSGKHPLTPLAFPHHLNHWIERNVSSLDTFEETRRILRSRPGVIVMSATPSNSPANGDSRLLVESYAFNNCSIVELDSSHEINHGELIAIYGDCREGAPDLIEY